VKIEEDSLDAIQMSQDIGDYDIFEHVDWMSPQN
jgi:hypothetical protein